MRASQLLSLIMVLQERYGTDVEVTIGENHEDVTYVWATSHSLNLETSATSGYVDSLTPNSPYVEGFRVVTDLGTGAERVQHIVRPEPVSSAWEDT